MENKILDYNKKDDNKSINRISGFLRIALIGFLMFRIISYVLPIIIGGLFSIIAIFAIILVLLSLIYNLIQGFNELISGRVNKFTFLRWCSIIGLSILIIAFVTRILLNENEAFIFNKMEIGLLVIVMIIINFRDIVIIPKEARKMISIIIN